MDIGRAELDTVEIIAPNFKRRLSGVTSTIIQLVPVQNRLAQQVASLGPGLPSNLPHIRFADILALRKAPKTKPFRIWHARRNNEMLAGLVLRDLLRFPLKLVFTSASQRPHSAWSRFLIGRMDQVIATSRKTAAYLKRPSAVIMHGIDTQRFSPVKAQSAVRRMLGLPENGRIAGCFGRIRHQKGTDLFVEAMIDLLPGRPDWMAIVAGRTTQSHLAFENALKARIETAGLTDRIRFIGEHGNIDEWYKALDLFIAPQRWEGFGLTPLEAMASGVPVIATDVGAFSELLATGDPETGILIPPDNFKAMLEAARAMMDDPARREMAGKNGRARALKQFSIEGEALAIGKIYAAIFAGSQ